MLPTTLSQVENRPVAAASVESCPAAGAPAARRCRHARRGGAAQAVAFSETRHRPFFVAGVLTVLTAGATWGALILLQIARKGSFTGVSALDINTHGHAQIFGWMGLFIMGFAYQAFPRFWKAPLVAPFLTKVVLGTLVTGLIVRGSSAFWGDPGMMIGTAVLGELVCLFAVMLFVQQMLWTFLRSAARLDPSNAFVLCGLGFFLLQSLYSLWHTWNTTTAGSRDELLYYLATWQAPLRDLQIHGLGLLMILGVCLRVLPAMLGVPRTSDGRAWAGLAVLLGSVLGEVGIFIAYRLTDLHWVAALLLAPWLGLLVGAWLVAWPWRLWRVGPVADARAVRSVKFVQVAYVWLAASLLMLLFLPVYQAISGISFSHAYYGAIRHAITVGFVSLMIMGIGAKVAATHGTSYAGPLSRLWGPFLLINAGCFLRVSLQVATDWHPVFYRFIGISGLLEVSALAWWGYGVVWLMCQGAAISAGPAVREPGLNGPVQAGSC